MPKKRIDRNRYPLSIGRHIIYFHNIIFYKHMIYFHNIIFYKHMFTFFSIIGSMLMLYLQYIEKILEKLLKKYKKAIL